MKICCQSIVLAVLLVLTFPVVAGELNFRSIEQCAPSQKPCIALLFEGPIEEGDSDVFRNWIENPPPSLQEFAEMIGHSEIHVGWVFFDSPGGNLFEAMKIGELIREHQITTQVAIDSKCYSACVIAILGGVGRISVGQIGIHSFYSEEFLGSGRFGEASDWYNQISEQVEGYLRRMRVPVRILDLMKATPHTSIHILDDDERHDLQVFGFDPVWLQTKENQ